MEDEYKQNILLTNKCQKTVEKNNKVREKLNKTDNRTTGGGKCLGYVTKIN